MISANLKLALKRWAPAYADAIESGKAPVHVLQKATADISNGAIEDINCMTARDGDEAMDLHRKAVPELTNLIIDKKAAQLAAARTARPVDGQDGSFGMPGFSAYSPAPVFRDAATGAVVKSYRHGERIAPASAAGADYGIGDIVKAAVTGDWSRVPTTVKAGAAGIGPAGGFLVAPEMAGFVIDLARAQARVMQAGALTIPMERGTLSIATVDSDPTPAWKAENAHFAVDQGKYGQVVLASKTLGVIVPLSLELVTTAANVNEIVTSQLTKRMALTLDAAAISGDGTQNQPRGIVSHLPAGNIVEVGAPLASGTAYGKWGAAIGKTLAANAELGSLSVLHNSDVSTALDDLVDTLGQPLRPTPNYASIANRNAVYIANGIPTTSGSTFSLVGDFNQVIIGTTQSLTLEVSREGGYKNADGSDGNAFSQGQVLVRAYMMIDVAIQRPNFFAQVNDIQFA